MRAFRLSLAAAIALSGTTFIAYAADGDGAVGQIEYTEAARQLCRGALPDGLIPANSTLFGHFRFPDASMPNLTAVPRGFGSGTCRYIHRDASAALSALLSAARAEDPAVGRDLYGLSCHRSTARQAGLYCRGSLSARRSYAGQAHWVAPPGFSEHATGLAIDFGARSAGRCNLEPCFSGTRAGRWLATNAARFGFEMSFPENNGQGIAFEPWHFRYVGTDAAQAAFDHVKSRAAPALDPVAPVPIPSEADQAPPAVPLATPVAPAPDLAAAPVEVTPPH